MVQFISGSNTDVPLGEDEVLEAIPDQIVRVLGASKPGGASYETTS